MSLNALTEPGAVADLVDHPGCVYICDRRLGAIGFVDTISAQATNPAMTNDHVDPHLNFLSAP
jgi:hypothetical protein